MEKLDTHVRSWRNIALIIFARLHATSQFKHCVSIFHQAIPISDESKPWAILFPVPKNSFHEFAVPPLVRAVALLIAYSVFGRRVSVAKRA